MVNLRYSDDSNFLVPKEGPWDIDLKEFETPLELECRNHLNFNASRKKLP